MPAEASAPARFPSDGSEEGTQGPVTLPFL